MAMINARMHITSLLVLMISNISMITDVHARARILVANKVTGFDKPKGAIKTIESYETGEVIDCVDIFKQPAFDHPLLKNHTIQMKTRSNMKANGEGHVEGAPNQAWWIYGECPEGTIPIRRSQKHNHRDAIALARRVKRLNQSRPDFTAPSGHEYATVSLSEGKYLAARATINVWNPTVMDQEASISQIWLASGPEQNTNTVEAGWMVEKFSNTSKQAKSFIYWTSDGYKQTGCYNLECPGFVQTSSKFTLGTPLLPVSTYGGQQYDISIEITKDDVTGHWWLRVGDVDVGYWPSEIFNYLNGLADLIVWGGEIFNKEPGGSHTSTQMGSGHFPSEGFGKASFFRHLKIVDDKSIQRDPDSLEKYVTRPECYDLLLNKDPPSTFGVNFYYGGPGFSAQCAK